MKAQRPSEADYVPLFHSQIPKFFRNRRIAIDVAIIQVAPPDRLEGSASGYQLIPQNQQLNRHVLS